MLYIIGIGSNDRPRQRLAWARERLQRLFPDIRFSVEEKTVPLGLHRKDFFVNQVACFTSVMSPSVVKGMLKELETEAGRKPEDRKSELVCLDIDLLSCDGTVYKAADWHRDYIRRGVRELSGEQIEERQEVVQERMNS